mmetsp:Transcript_56046/g.137462  ORF Transcript_56046/g.137462 Transcript_56046/m.137462 type:complete len:286 (-) Transcript_56046:262-1119(-)
MTSLWSLPSVSKNLNRRVRALPSSQALSLLMISRHCFIASPYCCIPNRASANSCREAWSSASFSTLACSSMTASGATVSPVSSTALHACLTMGSSRFLGNSALIVSMRSLAASLSLTASAHSAIPDKAEAPCASLLIWLTCMYICRASCTLLWDSSFPASTISSLAVGPTAPDSACAFFTRLATPSGARLPTCLSRALPLWKRKMVGRLVICSCAANCGHLSTSMTASLTPGVPETALAIGPICSLHHSAKQFTMTGSSLFTTASTKFSCSTSKIIGAGGFAGSA